MGVFKQSQQTIAAGAIITALRGVDRLLNTVEVVQDIELRVSLSNRLATLRDRLKEKEKATALPELELAVIRGNAERVDYLLGLGISANHKRDDGVGMIHLAAEGGVVAVVEKLVTRGADVNAIQNNRVGETPLTSAARANKGAVIRFLLGKEADPNKENKGGYTPLCYASASGNLDAVKALLSSDVTEIDKMPKDGLAALHSAGQQGHVPVIKYLLHKGADVNLRSGEGFAPLYYAIKGRKAEAAKEIIGHEGLDSKLVFLKNAPLDNMMDGEIIINQILKEVDRNFVYSLEMKNKASILCLMEVGADVNDSVFSLTNDVYGSLRIYPIYVAVLMKDRDLFNDMQQKGAIIGRIPSWRRSFLPLLHFACLVGARDMIKDVIDAGVGIDALCPCHGDSALHVAVKLGRVEIAKALISAGASKTVKIGGDGETPIDFARKSGNKEMMDLFQI